MVFSVTGLTISPNLLVATPSPLSANLLVSSPELIFTSDVVAYQPTDFRVTITNTSNIPIENQFQVDIFIDPENVTQDSIAIEESDGSVIVDSIGAGQSRIITITAPLGFDNSFDANTPVYSMVDSLQTINETDENNNISLSTTISERPPAPTPEPTSTNTPSNIGISGTVNYPTKQETTFRTEILVLNENNQPTAFTFADRTTGDYSFFNLPEGTYTIKACGTTDIDSEKYYYGLIEGIIIPPDSVANIPTIKTDSCEDPWFLDN